MHKGGKGEALKFLFFIEEGNASSLSVTVCSLGISSLCHNDLANLNAFTITRVLASLLWL